MKKILKKVFVIVFAATLFALPVSTAYAAITPTLIYRAPDNSIQAYSYDYIEYNDGTATPLYDISTSDQSVFVPAGKSFTLYIGGASNSTLRILVFGKTMYYYDYVTSGSNGEFAVYINANSYDDNYHVWIDAANTYVHVYNYQFNLY